MENLQMAMLVWASRQKSDGVGTQIDDAGDRVSYRQRIACRFVRLLVNTGVSEKLGDRI